MKDQHSDIQKRLNEIRKYLNEFRPQLKELTKKVKCYEGEEKRLSRFIEINNGDERTENIQ